MASPPVEPTSPRVRDVIFTLVRGGSNPATDYSMLKQSIACTRKAMRPVGPLADAAGFHEGNVPALHHGSLRRLAAASDS